MIFLQKNTVNKVVLTLSENSRLASPFYLFELTNEFQTYPYATPIYYTTPDTSSATIRFNLFDFELSSTGSTTGGTAVALNLQSGQYNYKVYEATASTLSVSATTGNIVESGRLIVQLDNQTSINTQNIYN